jgi:hypothetical protein
MSIEQWWNDIWQGENQNAWIKAFPNAAVFTANFKWIILGKDPGLLGESPLSADIAS